jgi:hypothetical protein
MHASVISYVGCFKVSTLCRTKRHNPTELELFRISNRNISLGSSGQVNAKKNAYTCAAVTPNELSRSAKPPVEWGRGSEEKRRRSGGGEGRACEERHS